MKFKRIIAVMLTLAVAATTLPHIVTERRAMFAEEGESEEVTTEEVTTEETSEAEEEPDDGSEYEYEELEDGTLSLTKYNGAGGDVVIPEEIDGKRVTIIGMDTFSECTSLTSVVIPYGVKSIGWCAFWGCSSLTSILIPNSVTSIGYGAFRDCSSLASVEIPDSVTSIDDMAFCACSSLTSIVIPNGVTNIGDDTFHGCSSLISIVIPDSVTDICHRAFKQCISLTSILIPDGVINIGNGAFYECTSLASIVISNSVTSIGDGAFWGCSSLISIEIPNNVASIGESPLGNCTSLTEIDVDDKNTSFSSEDGILFNKDRTSLIQYPAGKTYKSYSIPNTITKICKDAFYSCHLLKSIEIPNNVISIGDSAFCFCTSLTSIEIPDGVTRIGAETFCECTSLSSIVIPDSVTSIDIRAFYKCDSLTSIEIPNNVTIIGENAFIDCRQLTTIVIPDNVTNIGSMTFYGCHSLTTIVIPDSVTSISENAFDLCHLLTIYGTAGSYAQTYANEHSINFVALGSEGLYDIETGVIITAPDLNNATLTVTKEEEPSIENSFVYGIDLKEVSGSEFQPTEDVTVKIPVPSEWDGSECKVYRKEADGKYTDMNAEYENHYMVFTADRLGKYIITAEQIITDPIISDTENDTGVNIVLPDEGVVPDDTILNVDKKPSEEYNDAFVFDITLTLNGQPIQPNAEVTVRIPIPAGEDGFLFMVYYRAKDGKLTDMKATVSGLYLMFKTDHFSEYIVTKEKLIPDYVLGDINSDGKINTADARWVLQCASGKRTLTDCQRAAADVNGDGKINTADAKWLLQVASGKRQLG